MAAKKAYKLDLQTVLQAIDRKDLDFYDRLTDEEKKAYVPLVLMRFISSLTDQNRNVAYAVIATNDVVNIGFWSLSKHPELQHKLLCVAGLGGKQYRPWIAAKKGRKANKINAWLLERYPDLNDDELDLLKDQWDVKSWTSFLKGSGIGDAEVKEMVEAWKKLEQ